MKRFPPRRDFRSLSVQDLLEAREAYHMHLAHLDNVVATAIGLYRIRREDPDAEQPEDAGSLLRQENRRTQPPRVSEPRTLRNSVTRTWSWPCVLVFVSEWRTQSEFANDPDAWVPRFLYLPDGRVVPTCVILAERDETAGEPIRTLSFPSNLIGGGYPLLTDHQGEQRVGSIGCLVTDGDTVYALTNRHAVGEPGREITSIVRGCPQRIGISDRKSLRKKPFDEVYRGWLNSRSQANLDVGLVRIDDVTDWTAQVFGIGELGTLIDLNPNTITLDLIGCPVRAYGGASGELKGQIQGLFYRYRSVGGFDYVADLLIGPRDDRAPLQTRPGDSGTLWVWDTPTGSDADETGTRARAPQLRPMALQWGGHVLVDGGSHERMQFALATSLSTVCRMLDVDVIRDWNTGHSEYWGKVGHYKVGLSACDHVRDKALAKLMAANQDRIAYGDQQITNGTLDSIDPHKFVPLADVADLVWRDSRPKDAANHFADMDEEGTGEFAGKTLRGLYEADPKSLNPELWNRFYEALGTELRHRGALPFRVWQIYEEMVSFVRKGELADFVCAAGCLAHFGGDACQPLHVSRLHHGHPGVASESRVHELYETHMLDQRASELVTAVNKILGTQKVTKTFKGGKNAAGAMVDLMIQTLDCLPPEEIIAAFNARSGQQRIPYMWDTLGERTAKVIAAGVMRLAQVWESAWAEGLALRRADKEPDFSEADLGPVSRQALMARYNNPKFLPSDWLREMAPGGSIPLA